MSALVLSTSLQILWFCIDLLYLHVKLPFVVVTQDVRAGAELLAALFLFSIGWVLQSNLYSIVSKEIVYS